MDVTIEHQSLIMQLQVRPFRLMYVQSSSEPSIMCCVVMPTLSYVLVALLTDCPRETNRTHFYLDKNVHLLAA